MIFALQKETITLKRGGEKGLGFSIAGGRGSTPYKDGDPVNRLAFIFCTVDLLYCRNTGIEEDVTVLLTEVFDKLFKIKKQAIVMLNDVSMTPSWIV